MSEALIQLPTLQEVKEFLAGARTDIDAEIKEDPTARESSTLILKVVQILEEKIAKAPDFTKLNERERIDLGAYLNFLNFLWEDFFSYEMEDDEDFDEDEEFDEEED